MVSTRDAQSSNEDQIPVQSDRRAGVMHFHLVETPANAMGDVVIAEKRCSSPSHSQLKLALPVRHPPYEDLGVRWLFGEQTRWRSFPEQEAKVCLECGKSLREEM